MANVSLIDGHIDEPRMTDNEIIKALEYCVDKGYCPECPCYKNNADCKLEYDVIKLINRQKAEVERLKKHTQTIIKAKQCVDVKKQVETEAIKEFADRLKAYSYHSMLTPSDFKAVAVRDINNLVKEMVEGK